MPTLVHNQRYRPGMGRRRGESVKYVGTWLDTPKDIERYSRALPPHLRHYAGLQAKIEASRAAMVAEQ